MSAMDDYDDIRRVVQLYVDGANGDVAKLEEAFHPEARMYGHIGPMETNIPITDFFKMIGDMPGLAGPSYKATISSIDLVGDAAVASLV